MRHANLHAGPNIITLRPANRSTKECTVVRNDFSGGWLKKLKTERSCTLIGFGYGLPRYHSNAGISRDVNITSRDHASD